MESVGITVPVLPRKGQSPAHCPPSNSGIARIQAWFCQHSLLLGFPTWPLSQPCPGLLATHLGTASWGDRPCLKPSSFTSCPVSLLPHLPSFIYVSCCWIRTNSGFCFSFPRAIHILWFGQNWRGFHSGLRKLWGIKMGRWMPVSLDNTTGGS